jgi:hypothetical protein
MFSPQHRSPGPAWLVVALLTATPAPAQPHGGAIVLRNDTPYSVRVNVSSIYRGHLLRAPSYQLLPKAVTPAITLSGNKVVVISDARFPTRVLYQGTIPASDEHIKLSIQPDRPPPRVTVKPAHSSDPGGP